MNILYLSDVSLDIVGGAQESMKIVMDGLKKEHNFQIITPKNNKSYNYNVIELEEYESLTLRGKKTSDIINIIKRIKKSINMNNIDIIHVQMPSTMLLIGIMKKLRIIEKNIKVLYTDRGVLDKYGKKTYYGIKIFNRFFEKIILTTNNNKLLYKDMLAISSDKLKVIHNTPGKIFEKYDAKIREDQRRKMGVLENERVIMFSARMHPDKDWPLALEIIKDLSKFENIKIILAIGSDKTKDNISKCNIFINEVKKYIDEDNLRAYIDVDLSQMEKLHYVSDIFILTSKIESFGRTAIEAMSRKSIVYGRNVDGLKEVIKFKENIYVNKDDVINKIKYLLKDEVQINIEKNKFYNRFKEKFSLEINLKLHRQLYKEFM